MKYYEGMSVSSGGGGQRRAVRFSLHAQVIYRWKDRSVGAEHS